MYSLYPVFEKFGTNSPFLIRLFIYLNDEGPGNNVPTILWSFLHLSEDIVKTP